VRAVPALIPRFPVLTEEQAATPLRRPPRAQPIAPAVVSLPRMAQAAQVAQAAQASDSEDDLRVVPSAVDHAQLPSFEAETAIFTVSALKSGGFLSTAREEPAACQGYVS
jgi:hypothetical protein